jgi:hypothetical protein
MDEKDLREQLAGLDRAKLVLSASLDGRKNDQEAEDAVQDFLLKALQPGFSERLPQGVPPEPFLRKCVRNQRKDALKKKRPLLECDLRSKPLSILQSEDKTDLDDREWFQEMSQLLTDPEINQAIKDFRLMSKHTDPVPVPKERRERVIDHWKRHARVLALLATPGAPQVFSKEDRDIVGRWAHRFMDVAFDLRNHALNPGRNRPLIKLESFAQALLAAMVSAGNALLVPTRGNFVSDAALMVPEMRRIAAFCFIVAFRKIILWNPRLKQNYFEYCAGKKGRASGRKAHSR